MIYSLMTTAVIIRVFEEVHGKTGVGRPGAGGLALRRRARPDFRWRGRAAVWRAARAAADDDPDGDGASAEEGLPRSIKGRAAGSILAVCPAGPGDARAGAGVRG